MPENRLYVIYPPDTPSDAAVCLRSCAALSADVEALIDGIDALAGRS